MAAKTPQIHFTTADDPNLIEAMRATPEEGEGWINAIDDELKHISENKTWEADVEPRGMPLTSHVVVTVKRDA